MTKEITSLMKVFLSEFYEKDMFPADTNTCTT